MPPKVKFTKRNVEEAAFCIVRESGMEALTARSLAEKLKSSVQPIFTVFRNMEEVQKSVKKSAEQKFAEYIREAFSYTPTFKQIGMAMLRFAVEEPRLFQLLFMCERKENGDFFEQYTELDEFADMNLKTACIKMLQKEYAVTDEEAKALFWQVWIFTFGVGVLCVTQTGAFTEEDLEELLGREFISMLMYIKSGRLKEKTPHPQKVLKEIKFGEEK